MNDFLCIRKSRKRFSRKSKPETLEHMIACVEKDDAMNPLLREDIIAALKLLKTLMKPNTTGDRP